MNDPFVDTDIIIRLLTGDDLAKQKSSAALFEQVEQRRFTLLAPDTVIADAIYVLSSPRLYNLPRDQIRQLLVPLLRLPRFKVRHRRALLMALDIYAGTKLDFGDAFLVVSMQQRASHTLYSYDTGFDKIPGINRQEP